MLSLASDHAGYALKKTLLEFLHDRNVDVVDAGPNALDPEDDYPDTILRAVRNVADDPVNNRAIIIGGSGQGEAIVANRFPGVRAAVYYGGNLEIMTLSREHNDANILSLGARFMAPEEAKEAVARWLETAFSNEERHRRRLDKIERMKT